MQYPPRHEGCAMTDWKRVAAPQEDGSDTAAILGACGRGRYAERPAIIPAGPNIWNDGRARWALELTPHQRPSPEYEVLPVGDAILLQGLRMLDLWPAARRQCAELLVGLCPMTTESRKEHRGKGHGCSCGHFGDDFGWIYVTADDAWGFAEGVVHEMAHWKLRALGIWFEEWTGDLLENSPSELFTSPVRKDKARPMGAVLHAQYSYIHVARMSTLMLQATEQPSLQDIDWADLQLRRITEGQETLRTHARGTLEKGRPFLQGVDRWTSEVLTAGHDIVEAARVRGGLI